MLVLAAVRRPNLARMCEPDDAADRKGYRSSDEREQQEQRSGKQRLNVSRLHRRRHRVYLCLLATSSFSFAARCRCVGVGTHGTDQPLSRAQIISLFVCDVPKSDLHYG